MPDPESQAAAVYALAGADPEDPPGPYDLASMLGLHVRYGLFRRSDPAALICAEGSIVIHLSTRGPLACRVWSLAHEIAEWWLMREAPTEHRETEADALAAALVMPGPAFRGLVRAVGLDLPALAAPWPASETAAALRYLEALDVPGVVLTPTEARYRGPEWVWPSEAELRRIASGDRREPRLRVERLTDRRASVMVLAV